MTGATARQAEAPPTNEPLDTALAYARRGWRVLPVYSTEDGGRCTCEKGRQCDSPGKHPVTPHGVKDATTDKNQIRAWWTRCPDSNVGVATGNGLIVLDVDGSEGVETLRKLQDQYGKLPETYLVQTGKGLHYYYLWSDSQAVRNSAGKLGPGLDVRGDGGYVVAPPSLHQNGRCYNVAHEAEVANLPPEWVEAIKQAKSKAKSLPVPVTTQSRSHSRVKVQPTYDAWQRLRKEAERIATAKPGEQEPAIRDGAYGIGLQVGAGLLDHSDAKAILIAAGLRMQNDPSRNPWTQKEIVEKIERGLRAGMADVSPELAELNARYFVVSKQGKTRIATTHDIEGKPIQIEFSTFQDFGGRYNYRKVVVGQDQDGNDQKAPLGKYWLVHPWRRQYDRIVFDPSGRAPPGFYNLWTGFAVEAKPGDWSRFRRHIEDNLCKGNGDLANYVLNWMAYCVQHPEKQPGVALVLRGGRGTGKGIFARSFGELFGRHFFTTAQGQHLLGNFNHHLRDKLVVFADEAFWAGDKSGEGVLKAIITEPTLAFEAKGFDVEHGPNHVHLIIASNESWVVPAGLDERRFCVLDLAEERAQDTAYFGAIVRQLQNGGDAAMLHDLQKRDLSGFNVFNVPQTQALLDQKAFSMDPLEEWWEERLSEGKLLLSHTGWKPARGMALCDSYLAEAKEWGIRYPLRFRAFAATLRKLLPEPGFENKQKRDGKARKQRYWHFPPLAECRKHWDKKTRTLHDWPSDDE